MPDIREWISQVKWEAAPDYWEDVRRHERSGVSPADDSRPPRVLALATGVAAGALALVLAIQAFYQAPAPERPPADAKSNGIIAFLRTDPRTAIPEGAHPKTELFVVGPQGGDVERLVSRADFTPSWSPDGGRIAYARDGTLYAIDVESRTTSPLVACEAPCPPIGTAAWSTDGARIAYSVHTIRHQELWVSEADGANSRKLRDDMVFGAPTWSPDGRLLAVSGRIESRPGPGPTPQPTPSGPAENDGIFVISAETGALVRTIRLQGLDPGATVDWSPDGEWLVFDAIGEGGVDYGVPTPEAGAGIYLIRPDGRDRRLVTAFGCEEGGCTALDPEWSPDGEEIAFTRSLPELGSDGNVGDLYVIDVDSSEIRQITGGPGLDCCAAWQPLPAGVQPSIVPEQCPMPAFTVSSLPWLAPESSIPAPERLNEGGDSGLVWFEDPPNRWAGQYVALGRSSEPPIEGDLSAFPTVSVLGTRGRLVWVGDPGVGELSIVWRDGAVAAGCMWYSLTLGTAGMSSDEAESSIREIAGSLEERSALAGCVMPEIRLDRQSARPGERVSFEGECVPKDWDHGYGLFLLHDSPSCELIAGGIDVRVEVEQDGTATGTFTVPEEGSCFQSSAGPRPVAPGEYSLGLGCHACLTEATLRIL